jgi:hypothetical protein
MNVSIHDLPAHIVETYEATARARGISLDAFLREYLIRNAPSSPPAQMSPDEWEKALDDCFDSFPATGPLPDEAFSREKHLRNWHPRNSEVSQTRSRGLDVSRLH